MQASAIAACSKCYASSGELTYSLFAKMYEKNGGPGNQARMADVFNSRAMLNTQSSENTVALAIVS
jgi:hypothetical protein